MIICRQVERVSGGNTGAQTIFRAQRKAVFLLMLFLLFGFAATVTAAPSLDNGGFEYPNVSGYQYEPSGSDWSHSVGSGYVIADSGSAFGNTAYAGSQNMVMQGAVTVYQSVSGFEVGKNYTVSWAEADRPSGYGGNNFNIVFDSTVVCLAHTAASTSWQAKTSSQFTATSTTHTLKFQAFNTGGGDKAVFIDAITIDEVPGQDQNIYPNDDCTVRSGVNYDADDPFGLIVKNSSDASYIEFTIGSTEADSAILKIHNDDSGVSNDWDVVVKGAEYNFTESTFTGTDTSGWSTVGTIQDVHAVAFYTLDITTFYNNHLDETVTLLLTRTSQPAGSGPIFEDHEGTKTSNATTYGPRIEVTFASGGGGGWTELTYDEFESGYGNYSDGGSDCIRYTGGTYAHQGSCAIDIQDNSGTVSSFYHTNGIDVSSYSELKVEFWFYPSSMESGENFFVEFWDGDSWEIIANYVSGTHFSNGSFYEISDTDLVIDSETYNFPSDGKFRFRCDASDDYDDVYIDEVKISGKGASTLAAHWKFDESTGTSASDSSGNGNTGTLNNMSDPWVSGYLDNALEFDGSDDYVSVADSDSVSVGNGDFTISAWIYPHTLSGNRAIAAKLHDTYQKEYALTIKDGGEIELSMEDSGNNGASLTGEVVTANEWQHIMATYDVSAEDVFIYLDGVSQTLDADTIEGPSPTQTDALNIGRWGGTYNNSYFDGLIDDVKILTALKPYASAPTPAVGATSVSTTTDLSWTAGTGATSHDVYFGVDSTPDSSEFKGNQGGTTYDTGTMSNNTTYYWRIDEVNGGGTTEGVVWSFTTVAGGSPPGAATNPTPANSATNVAINTDLSWTAGSGATSHDVYFGQSSPGAFQGNQAGTTLDTGTMSNNTTYYWRIDEVNAYGTTTGTVWSFTTIVAAAGQASDPTPADSATDVAINTDLSWTAGSGATSHDVYFGQSSPGASQGNQGGTTYDTGTMSNDTTYYWRIDEVNAAGTTTGVVWSFTTIIAAAGQATNPTPSNSATGVAIDTDLNWTAGARAASHDVYFGTDSTPDSTEFQGNLESGTTYDTGAMSNSTTYYWRIDEINAAGTTTGTVWNFTTEAGGSAPGAATNPTPANSATNVAINTDLSWTAGSSATSHDVYFGISSPGSYQGSQAGTTFDTETMANNTTYYWRIDEVNPFGTTTGSVWSFTTIIAVPGQASNPTPANSATDVAVNTDLSWTAGSGATSHDVYFGQSSPGASQGNQAGTTYDTGTMSNNTTYYWRIDEVNAAGTTTGVVWSFTTVVAAPGQASNPTPANSATDVSLTTDLSWTAGSGAASHDVYFGQSSPGTFQGNQAGTTFDTGTMDNDTTYYWRIDEINVGGTTTGTVWSFTTVDAAPGQASNPTPANSATDVGVTTDISWTAGARATSHDVYFGEDSTPDSTEFKGNQAGNTYDTGTMDNSTTYYWRIDEVNAGGTTTGIVWSFTTAAASGPGQATSPTPANNAVNALTYLTLSWAPGSNATSHNVYFGQDSTPDSGEFQGNQSSTTFDTGTLSNNTTYYWRIDEINAQGTTTGTLWNFTTSSAGSGMIYLDNGTVKVGVNLNKGGAITYLSQSGSSRNVVNSYDPGREIQQSFYSGPEPFQGGYWFDKDWPWNPVEAGDGSGNWSTVLSSSTDGTTIYTKNIPKQWALNSVNSECTYEKWVELSSNVVKIHWRMIVDRADTTFYEGRGQELPAALTTDDLYKQYTYNGSSPFTNGALSDVTIMGPPWDNTQATENWVASVDGSGWGVGIFNPRTQWFFYGFTGTQDYSPPGNPTGSSTSYIAPLEIEIIDHDITYEYDTYVILGNLSGIRDYVYENQPDKKPDYIFDDDRQSWNYHGDLQDSGWPINGYLHVLTEDSDPYMLAPRTLWNATDVPKLYVKARYNTTNTNAKFYWSKFGSPGWVEAQSKSFTITPDNQWHVYEVDLSSDSDYTNTIMQLRFDLVSEGGSGEYVDVASITTRNPDNEVIINDMRPLLYRVAYDNLNNGEDVYTDRDYTLTNVPVSLQGETYIMTANDDKQSTSAAFLTFEILLDSTVYVAHDDTISTKPDWMNGFVDTGDNIGSSHGATYSLYSKDYSAGEVILGGNYGGAGNSNYLIIVAPTSAVPPSPASNPTPADSATGVAVDTDLSWTAGAGATSHDVYFGTDSTPDSGESQGNQGGTTYDTGTMSNNTTYYWRIDEVNANGTTTGTVWSFTTTTGATPGQASNPTPDDEATNIDLDADLLWTAGSGATSHDVYFGTDSTPDSTEFQGNQAGTTFDLGILTEGTTYYWRIDEVNASGTTTGTVWSFTTGSVPGQASSPSPANSATSVAIDADLSWTAGSGATSHDVYFGQSSPGTYQGNQGGTTFDTGTMSEDTTYYWRIDEINGYGTTTGTVWSFTTTTGSVSLVISNLDPSTYNVESDALAVGELLYVDRTIEYDSVPQAYQGETFIQTENDDKDGDPHNTITFNINQNCTVYVAHDDRITTKPSWLSTWTDTGDNLSDDSLDNVTLSLFSKSFSTGTVNLYENGTNPPSYSMYTVIVVPTGGAAQPGLASNPSPANGAASVAVNTDLSWTAGVGATSHDVYFGQDSTPDSGEFQGNQVETTFDTGTMDTGTVYYWRIDEVNANGTTTGTLWSFSTEGAQITILNPGWEYPDVSGYTYRPSGSDWSFTANEGYVIADSGSAFGNTAYEGSQNMVMQQDLSVWQVISGLEVGKTYQVSWAEASRGGGLGDNDLRVWIDSTIVGSLHIVSDASWNVRTSDTFVATSTTHTLEFETLNQGGSADRSVFIDAVSIYETSATTAPKWKMYEVTLNSSGSPSNPFTDTTLTATVTPPTGGSFSIDGFYDGDGAGGQSGNVWKLRFSPDELGTWSWTTTSNDSGLNGQSGNFQCIASTEPGPVISNGHYFEYADGEPVYLIGNFLEPSQPTYEEFSHTLLSEESTDTHRQNMIAHHRDFHKANKMNIYIANDGDYSDLSTTPWVGTDSSNDKTRFDLSRWKMYDQIIAQLKNEGMLAEMWFFADDSGFGSLSDVVRQRLIKYGMARLGAYPHTMFVLCLEWQEGWDTSEVNTNMTYGQNHNPWGRLWSVHGTTGNFSFPDYWWADFMATQSGNSIQPSSNNSHTITNRNLANKPLIVEEFGLLESTYDERLRGNLWACFCGGAAGGGTGSDLPRLRQFIEEENVPFWNMAPNNGVTTSGFALVDSGEEYVVYVEDNSGSFYVTPAAGTYYAEWFNPRQTAGSAGPIEIDIISGGSQQFTPPDSDDWVLYISKSKLQAINPTPADGATDVSADAHLGWTAGAGATSHNVYFGEDSTPDSGEFQGNQAGTTFDPGTMNKNTTYYWRIDEVHSDGTATGTVWSFTTSTSATAGTIIVDPTNSARMVYSETYENDHLIPVCFAGPGDPEDFFYNDTANNITLLTSRPARCTYITAVLQDFGGGDPGSGSALDSKLDDWEGYITSLENAGVITVFFFFDDTQGLTSNWQELVDKCVAKFKHHKLLIWSVAEEYGEALTTTQVSQVAARIKSQDDNNHVVGVHQNAGNSFDFLGDSNLDMFLMQLSDTTASALHSSVKNSNANDTKILNMAEAPDHAKQTRETVRKWNWASIMGGASAVQVIWMGRASDDADWNTQDKYDDCARLTDFMESTNLNVTTCRDDLARGNSDYVLADPGNVYIVYGDAGTSLGVNVQAGTYHVEWFDPVDGDSVDEGSQALTTGDETFTKPGAIGNEAVLYLELE